MLDARTAIMALRALSGTFLLRAYRPVAILITLILIALYTFVVLLTLSFSNLWLLLLIPLIPITIVIFGIGVALWFMIQRLLPRKLSKDESAQLNGFTDKLFGVAEKSKTPYPILLFLIGKDVIRGRESSFLKGLIGDSQSLMKEFVEIQRIFQH